MIASWLRQAADALDAGDAIVIPTDTIYGLAARPDRGGAVARIFEVKGRPATKPLPILAPGLDALHDMVLVDDRVRRLAERFWPGPLTIVLPRAPDFTVDLGGARDTLGVRIPSCTIAMQLLAETGPLAVTSANPSGEPPATTVEEARRALGDSVPFYVDGGKREGLPSSVVSLAGGLELVREGAISLQAIRGVLEA